MKPIADLPQAARLHRKRNKACITHLKQNIKSKQLDRLFHEEHDTVFDQVDCLSCANCCKTLGPKFLSDDIDLIARHQHLQPGEFVDKYLYVDEDGDYVLRELPCPFLASDNRCKVYEVRPKACRDYPHTRSRGMRKWLDSTLKNTSTCPAVWEMLYRIRQELSLD